MSWFANVIYAFAGLGYAPVLAYQMIAQKKNRRGWGEKLFGPRASLAKSSDRKRVWVHAVSLGEINAARLFVKQIHIANPALDVVVSTTTDTGYARACQLFGVDRVFRYPLDFSWSVRKALRIIDPSLIVLVELEVWFNLTTLSRRRGVPVCVINGRLTERSCKRLEMLGPLARKMFKSLAWVGAQDEPIANRFKSLGLPEDRVTVTGSVKWDTAEIADRLEGQDELAAAMGIDTDAPLWVCGSTGPGEEAMLLDAYAALRERLPRLQLALIPRKPERFEEVASLVRQRGFVCVRRSERGDGCGPSVPHPQRVGHPSGTPFVFLGDTMGELRKFYSLADVVFVGRSLVPMGGSDPMEVAALAKPIVTGSDMSNFRDAVQKLIAVDGMVQVESSSELVERLSRIESDRGSWHEMGQRAQQVVKANQGATQQTIEHALELLS